MTAALIDATTPAPSTNVAALDMNVLKRIDPGCELGCHPLCWTAPDHRDADCCKVKRAIAAAEATTPAPSDRQVKP